MLREFKKFPIVPFNGKPGSLPALKSAKPEISVRTSGVNSRTIYKAMKPTGRSPDLLSKL
jgi:hypothetical protein